MPQTWHHKIKCFRYYDSFQPSRTNVTTLQFEQDGDVVTADGDGFITIYSVDSDGAYFVRMEFEVNKCNNNL
jgi:microtubule-associated protein-like 1/2